jgi:phosphoglucosamine mutase
MTEDPVVFNRYDVRGSYPDEIDRSFAERFGKAVATYALRERRGKVVVGRDRRDVSAEIYEAFIEGVRSTGASVVHVGESTTDGVALAASHYGGVGAMVTASHHAWGRTGFKLLYEEGYGFSNEDMEDVKDIFREGDFEQGMEGFVMNEEFEFAELYIESMLSFLEDYGGGDGTIVVDGCFGGACRYAPEIFEELGFDVVTMHCDERDETLDPEPGKENRQEVRERMDDEDAVLAVGYDPDADRVYVFHPELGWIGGNELLFLLARIVEAERVTASVDASGLLDHLDAAVSYTRVGDVFVAAEGYEEDADVLGEPNGHYAVTDFCWYNSGVLASALLALHAAELPALLEEVPTYHTERRVVPAGSMEEQAELMQGVMKRAAKNFDVVSTVDGVKVEQEGMKALVRPSGTSPKIRMVVNGVDGSAVEEWTEGLYDLLFEDQSSMSSN